MKSGRTPFFRSVMRIMRTASSSHCSRRDFLRLAGAAGLSAAFGSPLFAEKPNRKIEGPIAVVGGGIGGLTAALRLMQAGHEVHLYEALDRFGGRMWTKRDFNKDGMFVELGGELVDSNHTDLIELAKEVGVELQNLKEGDSGVDFYHFGGKIYTDKDVISAFEPLAKKIAQDAEGLYDDQEEFTAKAHQFDHVSLRDYLDQVGEGVDRWVLQMLEVAYVPEYGVDAEKQSSLNLIDFINPDTSEGFEVFGDSDEAMRIRGGNDTLPTAIHRALQGKVRLHGGHKLVRIEDDGQQIKLGFAAKSKVITPSYAHVVMALPFTILRDIEGVANLNLSEDKQRAIQEMGYGNNHKVMYGFTDRSWRQPLGGLSEICNGSVYSDKSFQSIWETSRGQSGASGIITNFMGGSVSVQYSPDHFEKNLAELDGIFPGIKAKADGNRTLMNWSTMKTMRGSYSSPYVGQYCWVYGAAALPELDGRLVFAGEHTSLKSPGFMNGGVESGNRAAKELLGIATSA